MLDARGVHQHNYSRSPKTELQRMHVRNGLQIKQN